MTDYEGIDFWYYDIGVNIISADTVNKDPIEKEWIPLQTTELEEVAYLANKASGKYDKGIAVICGKIWRGRCKGMWLNGIDLDNEFAIKEFNFKEEKNLIERHEDDLNSLHAYFVTDEPIQSKALDRRFFDPTLQPAIEVKSGGGKLMYCYPSMHGTTLPDGTKVIKQWKLNRLELPPYVNKEALEKSIDNVCAKYNLDYLKNRTAKDKIREKNEIPEGQRHNTLLTECNSIWWANLPDYQSGKTTEEQIFEKFMKVAKNCKPEHDSNDLERIFTDSKKYVEEEFELDPARIASQSQYAPKPPFAQKCIFYKTNDKPLKYIGGTADFRLVELELKNSQGVSYWVSKTFLAGKPTRMVRHRNILEFLDLPQRYTVEFEGQECGKFTLKQKTLSQIVSHLKNTISLTDSGIDNAMIAQLLGFKKEGIIEQNDDTDLTGFLISSEKSKEIILTNTEIQSPTVSELKTALEYINKLAEVGFKHRLDLLGHIIKFATIAPCAFLFKVTKGVLLQWVTLYGRSNASKSTSGLIILAFDGHETDPDYNIAGTSVDNMTRLAEAIRFTTFPKMLDEVDFVNDKFLPNNVKNSVDKIIVRSPLDRYRNKEPIPGLAACLMTSNFSPPLSDGAFMKRVTSRYFPDNEIHIPSAEECKIYDNTLTELHNLSALGQFRNEFILKNQDIILDRKLLPFEKAIKILISAYETADMLVPCWLIKGQLEQKQLEDSIIDAQEAVLNAWKEMFVDKFKFINRTEELERKYEHSERFTMLVDWGVFPYITKIDDGYTINSAALKELYKYGITRDQLPNVKSLADFMGARYKKADSKTLVIISIEQVRSYYNS